MANPKKIRVRNSEVRNIKRKYLLDDPLNWHTHGEGQHAALASVFQEIGFVGHILVRPAGEKNRFYIVDGHERATHFKSDELVPCCVLDVDETEAKKLLASYDPLGYISGVDNEIAARLLEHVEFEDADLNDAIAKSLERIGEVDAMVAAAAATEDTTDPPDEFAVLDENIETQHECPKCGYEWSGGKT